MLSIHFVVKEFNGNKANYNMLLHYKICRDIPDGVQDGCRKQTILYISDCMADRTDRTEIPSAKHTLLWSRNAMETKVITICCPITKFAHTKLVCTNLIISSDKDEKACHFYIILFFQKTVKHTMIYRIT